MIIAHLDMDCFYCSCEEKKDPKLKGKPVMVGATGDRGVISASNYQARKFGVYSATPISRARQLCPNGIFLPPDFAYYEEQSNKIMEFLTTISTDIVQVSIDEAYLNLTEYRKQFKTPEDMALSIQKQVKELTGLTCSIGISKSKTVAKIASDFNKPNGITVVHNMIKFLRDLPIEKIPGVGKVSKKHFNEKGIYKIGDIANKNRFYVLENFGMYGINIQDIAKGKDTSKLTHYGPQKSISRERTFTTDTDNKDQIIETINKLSKYVHSDLGTNSFKTISIKLRYSNFTTITKDLTLQVPTKSLESITNNAISLFEQCNPGLIRLIGIKLSKIGKEIQTTLLQFILIGKL